MKVCVEVHASLDSFEDAEKPWRSYVMNHDNADERRVLGEQCRNAFEGGQVIVTYAKVT